MGNSRVLSTGLWGKGNGFGEEPMLTAQIKVACLHHPARGLPETAVIWACACPVGEGCVVAGESKVLLKERPGREEAETTRKEHSKYSTGLRQGPSCSWAGVGMVGVVGGWGWGVCFSSSLLRGSEMRLSLKRNVPRAPPLIYTWNCELACLTALKTWEAAGFLWCSLFYRRSPGAAWDVADC